MKNEIDQIENQVLAICVPINWFGIWYLAQSLYKELVKRNTVYFIPRDHYNEKLFEGEPPPFDIVGPDIAFDREKLKQFVAEKKIETFIFIENYNYELAEYVKSIGCRIADMPMVEMMKDKVFLGGGYNIYDEVWGVSDFSCRLFTENGYTNVRRTAWDFADFDYFYPPDTPPQNDVYTFYHPASDPGYYDKRGTFCVLKAFKKVIEKVPAKLLITTMMPIEPRNFLERRWAAPLLNGENPSVEIRLEVFTRKQIADFYRSCDIVLCPDKRAGLNLLLFEAEKCGKKTITTDAPPMNEKGDFLCRIRKSKKTKKSIVPLFEPDIDDLARIMIDCASGKPA